MSIKRSREVSRRRTPDSDDAYRGKKEPERVYTWEADVAAHAAAPFVAYAPAHRYAKDARLVHKLFGAGIVTKVEGSKIEVLFKDGSKKLAHAPTGAEPPAADPPADLMAAQPTPTPAPSAPPPQEPAPAGTAEQPAPAAQPTEPPKA